MNSHVYHVVLIATAPFLRGRGAAQGQGAAGVGGKVSDDTPRPGVQRGRMVNRAWGKPESQLHERHDASDFDLRTQDKLETSE